MTSLQDKIAALKALKDADAKLQADAAKLVVLEEQVRVLREALVRAEKLCVFPSENVATLQIRTTLLRALAATDMGE